VADGVPGRLPDPHHTRFNLLGDGLRDAFDVRSSDDKKTPNPHAPHGWKGEPTQDAQTHSPSGDARHHRGVRGARCRVRLEEIELEQHKHHGELRQQLRQREVRCRLGTFDNGSSAKGGNYRIGWEQSFGFTNNFDPTGEYLATRGLYSNLIAPSLIGYKHLPGAAGNELIGDLATTCRSRRAAAHVHVQAPQRREFGPPSAVA